MARLWDLKARLYYLGRWLPPFALVRSLEHRVLRKVVQHLGPVEGPVLDVATGTGDALRCLPPGPAIFALDSSRSMLHYARRRFPGVRAVCGDALSLPFRRGTFELVCCIGLSEYVADPSTLLAALSHSLRPHGEVIFSTSPGNVLLGLRRLLGHRLFSHGPALMADLAEKLGFTVEQVAPSISQWIYVLRKAASTQSWSDNDAAGGHIRKENPLGTPARGALHS